MALGSQIGTVAGTVLFGPVGGLVGGLVGSLGDALFAGESAEEKARKRDEEMKKKAQLAISSEQNRYLQYPYTNQPGYLPPPVNMNNMT